MRWLLDLAGLSRTQVIDLLELAQRLEHDPEPRALQGKILTLLLLRPSFHTRASFEAAMARLGGRTIVIAPGMDGWAVETRTDVPMDGRTAHHARELIPAMATYSDALGVRAPSQLLNLVDDLKETHFSGLKSACPAPLINMESAVNHPCHALGDWKTLDDLDVPQQGGRLVLSWSYNPVAHPLAVPASVLHMAAARGMRVTLLRPDGYELPPAIMAKAQRAAAASGGAIYETDDRFDAMDAAHVLYTESWISPKHYGDPEAERELRERNRDWRIDELWFGAAQETCRFMHCLPVRRGMGVDEDLLDGARSLILKQARNRMLAQMSVLHRMLT